MFDLIKGILFESFSLLNQMSPYLLLGFLFAGILHVFISLDTVEEHLGHSNTGSVIKASIFGIPLPLCSCGVIPAAVSLRQKGASKSAVLSFLISTPTTGVDSILATYALLGPLFALYRVLASFVTAVLSGIAANLFLKGGHRETTPQPEITCSHCKEAAVRRLSPREKIYSLFHYAFVELLRDTGKWVLLGILIGGIISHITPTDFIRDNIGPGWKTMIIMLFVGIPMYVCASGSLPIAAALMLKGLNPGAAFVFLLAGPATNAVTITVVSKHLGKKAVALYLIMIAVASLLFGWLLDTIWQWFKITRVEAVLAPAAIIPYWLKVALSVVLLLLIVLNLFSSCVKRK